MAKSNHPNSRTITIYRSNSFLTAAQGKDVADFFSSSNQSIGSYFEKNSRRIGSGLTIQEEKLLLESVLGVKPDHPEFMQRLANFYKDMDTKVPYDTGVKLEIGLTASNTDNVSDKNMPLDLMDYLRYRHALNHPYVAESKEMADGNPTKHFYIFDKTQVMKKADIAREQQDAAIMVYNEVKMDEKKVRQALFLLGVNPDKLDAGEYIGTLRGIAEREPKKFLEVLKDKHFETNFWIQSMVDNKVLKKLNNKYFDAETDKLIGNSLEETIYFFNDDTNSEMIGMLKARLQEKTLK